MRTFIGTFSPSYAEIQPELRSDESVLWASQPQRKVIFRKDWYDWYVILIGLFVSGVLLSNAYHGWSTWGIWARRGVFVPMLIFAAFFVFGQYLLWGRFAYTAWRKGRTYYAVTTKRVMVLNAGSTRKITDMYFAKLDSVSLAARADGIGTIEFSPGPRRPTGRLRYPWWTDIDLSMLIFYDIEDARNVYQLIEDQRQQSLKWTAPTGRPEGR